jgi:glycosyltransferase involved in cell wall biosynthesis
VFQGCDPSTYGRPNDGTIGPQVSVVLPTYNRLQYLRSAIASVFGQTFTDWELIVADDGSEGEAAAYVAALANQPKVKVLRLPHTGNPGAVRNAACRVARGEYIAFLDSDDLWLPEKLGLQVASLRSNPQCGWSHTAFALIDEAGDLVTGPEARWWPAAGGRILEPLIKMQVVVAISSAVVNRRLFEQLRGFDQDQPACNDYDLWLRLAEVSAIDGISETLLYKRRQRDPYYRNTMVFEDIEKAIAKLIATSTDGPVRDLLHKERAKAATGLACSQAMYGNRWAALRTLARSSHYSWGHREWWLGSAEAAARVVIPPAVLRAARTVVGRRRG